VITCWSRPGRVAQSALQSDDLLTTVLTSIDRGERVRRPVQSVFDVLTINDNPGFRPGGGELFNDGRESRNMIEDDKPLMMQSFREDLPLTSRRRRRTIPPPGTD
jgi:hypothetical protein